MRNLRSYRPYQVDIHKFVTQKHEGSFGVEAPTGSGKTMQIVGLVAYGKKHKRWKKVLVATTQQQIEEAIVHREYDAISYGNTVLQAPNDLIAQARDGRHGTRKAVKEFLDGSEEFAMACTHATCTTFPIEDLPKDLTGHLLIADEGHHMPADGFSKFEQAWLERGGTIAVFTATGYRADGKKVGADDMEWFVRSMAQHMEEGYAPGNLHYGVVAVKRKAKVSYEQFTGSKAPPKPFINDIVRAMVAEWIRLGKGKTIVRVPPMAGGTKTLVQAIIKGFEKQDVDGRPCRVIDATGIENKAAFLKFIKDEARRRWGDSEADIVVGSQRVVEGTDWPHCENVFCVGIPGSVTTVVQLTGRAMRKKDRTCPKKKAEQANVVFFVPTGSNNTLKKMSVDHSRAILMISCFMADSKSGQQWLLDKELRRFKRKMAPEDPSGRTDVLVQMTAIRGKATREGRQVTLGELISETRKKLPNTDIDLIKKVAVEALAKSKKGGRIKDFIDKEHGVRPSMSKTAQRVLDTIVEEFRDLTLDGEDSMEVLGRQAHLLDGGNISEWAERVANSLPLEKAQIIMWACEWKNVTGRWPRQTDGVIPGTTETWTNIHGALKAGFRGLPGDQSLAQFLETNLGVLNKMSIPPFTEEDVTRWAKEWYEKNGQWPKTEDGVIPGTRVTWLLVEVRLRVGGKGMKGGMGLSRFLHTRLGVRPRATELTVEQIKTWIREWHSRMGEWPKVATPGVIPGTHETWAKIASALSAGRRGLEPGQSLAALVRDISGVRHPRDTKNAPKFTVKQIVTWAKEWYGRTGAWPTARTKGLIPGSSGENWHRVDWALVNGKRGLPGGMTLVMLLKKKLGASNPLPERVRRVKDPAAIAEFVHEVREKMIAWFKKTGKWPSKRSPTVPGVSANWHQVQKSLLRRGTSLPEVRDALMQAYNPSPGSSRTPAGGGSKAPSSGGSSRRKSPQTEASPAG